MINGLFSSFLRPLIEQQRNISVLFKSTVKNSKHRCQQLKLVLAYFSYAQFFYPMLEWWQNTSKLIVGTSHALVEIWPSNFNMFLYLSPIALYLILKGFEAILEKDRRFEHKENAIMS